MLKRNMNVEAGLVNGSVGVVTSVSKEKDNTIRTVSIKFERVEGEVEIKRETCSFEVLKGIFYTRKQFPLMLAFAITIHKAQGLGLTSVIVDAGSTCFGSGMIYVALSRVTSLSGLHLVAVSRSKIACDNAAVEEYNRLRQLYTPHLGPLTSTPTDNIQPPKRGLEATDCQATPARPELAQKQPPVTIHSQSAVTSSQPGSSDVQIVAVSHQSVYNHCHVTSLDDSTRLTTCTDFNLQFYDMPTTNTQQLQSNDARELQMIIENQTKTSINIAIHHILGDGNCLFRAISLGITGQQDQHQMIRDFIVNYMMRSSVRYNLERLYTSARRAKTYDEHLLAMQQVGEWGTDQEIVAAAEMFKCSIICASKFGSRINIQHFSPHFAQSPTCSSSCQHNSLYIINSSGSHYELVTVTNSDSMEE